jgi:SAM-dependent methyltransferase
LSTVAPCHLCRSADLDPLDGLEQFGLVTSDCKPWPGTHRLRVCRACGVVQKAISKTWENDTKRIYRSYTIYYQGDGAEQAVFDQSSGQPSSRSTSLLRVAADQLNLPAHGRMLDVGCGNGSLLKAFGKLRADWSLMGTEVSDKYRDVVEAIDGVEALYIGPVDEIDGRFDLITIVHVLEHIVSPTNLLSQLRAKLNPGGRLLIEVPNFIHNPFDLVIADHCSHFGAGSIHRLLERSGYGVDILADDWVAKEMTVVAGPAPAARSSARPAPSNGRAALDWLKAVARAVHGLANERSFGLFGTSIAATWLFGGVAGRVAFFVDEDPNRIGRRHLDRPIFAPAEIPGGADIFIALPGVLGETVAERLKSRTVALHLPPPLTS